MHPVLMTPSGIPRSGLVCWHDLYDPTSALASVPDLSGNGYSLQRGSTAGEDSNDPAWGPDGKGLVFGGEDYLMQTAIPDSALTGAVTMITAATAAASTSQDLGGKYTSGAVNHPLHFGTRGLTGNLILDRASTTGPRRHEGPSYVAGSPAVYTVRVASGLIETVPDFFVGALSTPGTLYTGDTGTGQASGSSRAYYLGARDGTMLFLVGAVYSHLLYNRALSNAEIQRIYRSLKATWAARGVVIL